MSCLQLLAYIGVAATAPAPAPAPALDWSVAVDQTPSVIALGAAASGSRGSVDRLRGLGFDGVSIGDGNADRSGNARAIVEIGQSTVTDPMTGAMMIVGFGMVVTAGVRRRRARHTAS